MRRAPFRERGLQGKKNFRDAKLTWGVRVTFFNFAPGLGSGAPKLKTNCPPPPPGGNLLASDIG